MNVVIDSLPVYGMGALLPQGFVDAYDSRRRAQCLVSWERVCLPKKDGGLDARNLNLQNTCLLLKLLHRVQDTTDLPWAQ